MKQSAVIVILALLIPVGAHAEDAAPNLVGTWSGPFRSVVFGNNSHHPGSQTLLDAPRVREITFTFAFEGQDGSLLWGEHWSVPEKREPFAATITADGRTIVGADTDGGFSMTITGPDQMNLCYTHTALSPTQSIVASCGTLDRMK